MDTRVSQDHCIPKQDHTNKNHKTETQAPAKNRVALVASFLQCSICFLLPFTKMKKNLSSTAIAHPLQARYIISVSADTWTILSRSTAHLLMASKRFLDNLLSPKSSSIHILSEILLRHRTSIVVAFLGQITHVNGLHNLSLLVCLMCALSSWHVMLWGSQKLECLLSLRI